MSSVEKEPQAGTSDLDHPPGTVDDQEIIIRLISFKDQWKSDEKRPTSALFSSDSVFVESKLERINTLRRGSFEEAGWTGMMAIRVRDIPYDLDVVYTPKKVSALFLDLKDAHATITGLKGAAPRQLYKQFMKMRESEPDKTRLEPPLWA